MWRSWFVQRSSFSKACGNRSSRFRSGSFLIIKKWAPYFKVLSEHQVSIGLRQITYESVSLGGAETELHIDPKFLEHMYWEAIAYEWPKQIQSPYIPKESIWPSVVVSKCMGVKLERLLPLYAFVSPNLDEAPVPRRGKVKSDLNFWALHQ